MKPNNVVAPAALMDEFMTPQLTQNDQNNQNYSGHRFHEESKMKEFLFL